MSSEKVWQCCKMYKSPMSNGLPFNALLTKHLSNKFKMDKVTYTLNFLVNGFLAQWNTERSTNVRFVEFLNECSLCLVIVFSTSKLGTQPWLKMESTDNGPQNLRDLLALSSIFTFNDLPASCQWMSLATATHAARQSSASAATCLYYYCLINAADPDVIGLIVLLSVQRIYRILRSICCVGFSME